jgi:hypothetical protein
LDASASFWTPKATTVSGITANSISRVLEGGGHYLKGLFEKYLRWCNPATGNALKRLSRGETMSYAAQQSDFGKAFSIVDTLDSVFQ